MSIVRPASASRCVIPISAAVFAVGESGTVWIPNNEPEPGTNLPVGRGNTGSGGVGAGGSRYTGLVVAACANGGATPPKEDARARAASAPTRNLRRAGGHARLSVGIVLRPFRDPSGP